MTWTCDECGSDRIYQTAHVNVNTGDTELDENGLPYCDDCGDETRTTFHADDKQNG